MNKRSFLLLGVLALTVGFGSITASAQGQSLKADIPFEFTVGKKQLPAGEYLVVLPQTGGAPTITVKSIDGDSIGIALTNWVNTKKSGAENGLTFVKSGDKYYLNQIHVEGREIGQEVAKTSRLAGTELARKVVAIKPAKS